MQLSFVETMEGTVRDRAGVRTPLRFEVSAHGGAGGRFALRGLAWALPWGAEVPAHGTLAIDARARTITYALRLALPGGDALTLDAQKRVSLRAPLRSMTRMPVTLRDAEGVVRAEGELGFALRTLPRFLASWLPVARVQQRVLDVRRRAVAREALRGG